jgi:acyl-coenzyme A thioesterase PaaI-like protein
MSATIEQLNTNQRYHHSSCFICGKNGLDLSFEIKENGGVAAYVANLQNLQGYDRILHGGIVTSLLDAAMVNCLFAHNITAYTAEIQVRFKFSVVVDLPLVIYGDIVKHSKNLYHMTSELHQNSVIMARAKAKFIRKR